jgi:ankyrin repeat protein
MVQWLLGLSCFVNAADVHGQTALIVAAVHGHKSVVACLLDASCDASLTDASLQSALHIAAAACSISLLPLLLPHRCHQFIPIIFVNFIEPIDPDYLYIIEI